VIAQYWANGPNSELPPGHWCLFAGFVSRRDRHELDADVVMFFALTNALLDAGIETWHVKRAYDYVRPITAIRELFAGRRIRAWAGPGRDGELIDGGQWQPGRRRSGLAAGHPLPRRWLQSRARDGVRPSHRPDVLSGIGGPPTTAAPVGLNTTDPPGPTASTCPGVLREGDQAGVVPPEVHGARRRRRDSRA
jgi:hypothetical protein